jgi:threonine dehydratase
VLEVPAHVYVPETAAPVKVEKIRAWGARVRQVGQFYHEAYQAALAHARRDGLAYVHAYADRSVIVGQGTVGLEFVEDRPNLDALLVAVGGGGLIAGIAAFVRQECPGIRVIGVEPEGAPSLHAALAAGGPVELERIDSIAADSMGAKIVGEINHALAARYVDRVVLVPDTEILAAQRFLWDEVRLVAEPGGAAALAGLLSGRAKLADGARVGVLVCGSNAQISPPGGH